MKTSIAQPQAVSLPASNAAWQRILQQAIRDPAELLARLQLDSALLPAAQAAARQFPLRVPVGFVNRMRSGDPADPLLRQVLPLNAELDTVPGYVTDPVGDLPAQKAPGLLHKYRGRALLITTGACGVHCRYCFRRHFPYADAHAGIDAWQPALAAIAADTSINEVILSGGDPLSLSDRKLAILVAALQDIPHLRRLRIHSRQPVVLPERVDAALLAWLRDCRLQKVLVLHCNHAQEIDPAVGRAAQALAETGTTLLNQAVLLAGINDSAASQMDLSEALFAVGVMPYYLNLLDPVAGSAHFSVPRAVACRLMHEVASQLPGYLVPRLVEELPGAPYKRPVAWQQNKP